MTDISKQELLVTLERNIGLVYELWNKTSKDFGYPVDYQGITAKSKSLIGQLDCFQGKSVLDIGCNSGFYSYITGMYAKSVLGCDVEPVLIQRCEQARPVFNQMYDTSRVKFIYGNFASQLRNDINGVMASLVLYHVGNDNLLALRDFLRKNKPVILLQARPMRAEAFRNNPSWGIVAATTLYNGMFLVEDNLDFLRDCGYDSAEVYGLNSTEFYGENFPVILAKG